MGACSVGGYEMNWLIDDVNINLKIKCSKEYTIRWIQMCQQSWLQAKFLCIACLQNREECLEDSYFKIW